jgi:hypothetical protein
MRRRIEVDKCVSDFFDFYAMYELYLRVGGFREEGYPGYDVFGNEPIFRRIKEKYEEVVDDFYKQILEALELSVAGEIDHFPKRCPECIAPHEPRFYDRLCKKAGITRKQIHDCKDDVVTYAEVVYALFSVPKWSAQYGGKKWAEAAKLLIESKTIKTRHEKVAWCDRVLDLQHNTGHLLNKTDFLPLSRDYLPGSGRYKALNFRAKARSVMNFVPYLSPSVRNLVIPRARLLDTTVQV